MICWAPLPHTETKGDGLVAEVPLRQLVHPVTVLRAVEHVGNQQRVLDRRHRNIVPGEDGLIVFDVVPDLEDGRIGQDRPELLEDLVTPELAPARRAELVEMGHRHVEPAALVDGKADADELRLGDPRGTGLGVEGQNAPFPCGQENGVEVLESRNHGEVGTVTSTPGLFARRLGRGRDLVNAAHKRSEAVLLEKGEEPFRLKGSPDRRIEPHGQRRLLVQTHQAVGKACLIGMLLERLPPFRLLDRGGVGEQRFE